MVASNDSATVHFVTHIYVVDQDGDIVGMDALDPVQGAPAMAEFDIPNGTLALQAYEWCNKHGLWQGPVVNVISTLSTEATCSKDDIDVAAYDSYDADFRRRQAMDPFQKAEPYTEADGKKHTPYIEVVNNTAIVTVGDGSPFHPMKDSSDPSEVHFVTHIWVVDQAGNIVVMRNLDPYGVDKATITFGLPSNATSLTAYEFCNLHGLWKGPTVSITNDDSDLNAGSRLRAMMSLAIVVSGALVL